MCIDGCAQGRLTAMARSRYKRRGREFKYAICIDNLVNMTSRTPEWLAARSLALHELVAAEIRRDPKLFERVRSNLARWQVQRASKSASYFAWRELIAEGMEAALRMATEQSERGNALRSASPFTGVLSDQARLAFLQDWKLGGRRVAPEVD